MIKKHNNKSCDLTILAVVSAAAVAVVGIGGYFLHKKAVKRRLQEFARRQAMNLAMFDYGKGNGSYDDYDDYEDEEYEDADEKYASELFEDFDKDGFFKNDENNE